MYMSSDTAFIYMTEKKGALPDILKFAVRNAPAGFRATGVVMDFLTFFDRA
jgi:hypothetical protein